VDALARSGVDSSEAAALLGHSETVMLRYYRTVRLSDLEAIARSCPFDKETT
jgi:integrase